MPWETQCSDVKKPQEREGEGPRQPYVFQLSHMRSQTCETRSHLGHPVHASVSLVSSGKSSFFYLLTTIARGTSSKNSLTNTTQQKHMREKNKLLLLASESWIGLLHSNR